MDHSIINPHQIRSFGIPVSYDLFDKTRELGIDLKELFIPLKIERITVLFDTYVSLDH